MLKQLQKRLFTYTNGNTNMNNDCKKIPERRGIISMEKLRQRNLDSKLDSVYIGFSDFYGRLSTIKLDPDYFLANYEQGFTLDSMILHSDIDGVSLSPAHKANKQIILKPDTNHISEMAWLKSKSFLVIGNVYNSTGSSLYPFAPRNILTKKVEEMRDTGYVLQGASELEYYMFNKKYGENYAKGLTRIKEFGSHPEDYLIQQGDRFEHIYEKIRTKLKDSGVPVESMKGEASVGQHEINVSHSEVLEMSDNVLILKSCIKSIADHNGTTITFMPKPNKDRMGSGSHLHLSLHSLDGKNVFPGKDHKLSDSLSCSDVMLHFLGGIMKYSLDTFILFAPTTNSYKRFNRVFSWAPSDLNSWSVDNRTSAFRICGTGTSTRIEYRIPGADINQYLAYAGLVAAGTEGIKNKIDPPKQNQPDLEKKKIPVDMSIALKHFENSEFINKSFGNDLHQHLITFYKNEVDLNERNVTKWEFNRYLDLI